MPLLLARRVTERSPNSVKSFIISSTLQSFRSNKKDSSTIYSFQTWWKKKPKRGSFPLSSSLQPITSTGASSYKDPDDSSSQSRDQAIPNVNTTGHSTPAQDSVALGRLQSIHQREGASKEDQIQGPGQSDQKFAFISTGTPAWSGRRRSSTRLRALLLPQEFTAEELKGRLVLSRPTCRIRVGCISQPYPEPGWRVATRRRSPESCFTTTRPLYSARCHSPLLTGTSFTIYFEGEIRPGNDEDAVPLALGFVAGRDRASRMPGLERGSIGIHCRDGGLYLNGNPLENVGTTQCEPGQHVGIGVTFSVSSGDAQKANSAQPPVASSPSINVELFLTRDGKKVGSWNLSDQSRHSEGSPSEGLEGFHDLYAAVGTSGEVNADILFERRDWRLNAEAGQI